MPISFKLHPSIGDLKERRFTFEAHPPITGNNSDPPSSKQSKAKVNLLVTYCV